MKSSIIFVHGLFGTQKEWEFAHSFFSAYSCRSFTLPGHGSNPFKSENYSVPNLSLWLAQQFTSAEPSHFVGYSLGGRVLLSLFEKRPEIFKSLTLISASPGLGDEIERTTRLKKDMSWAELLKSLTPSEFFERWYNQDVFRSLRNNSIFKNVFNERLEAFNFELHKVLVDSSPGQTEPMWSILKHIPNCLFITGEADTKYSRLSERMIAQGANIKIEILPKAGHSVHLESPAEFLLSLKRHLEESRSL
jgi:2-succinyl-6-hydroxy-2,4-cyclohexadiene-1-carboxylate synthase